MHCSPAGDARKMVVISEGARAPNTRTTRHTMTSIRPTKNLDDILELMSTEHQQLAETIARIKSAIDSQDLSVVRRELLRLQ